MKKEEKRRVEKLNADVIDKEIKNLNTNDLSEYFKKNLSSYISNAQRIAAYFGGLRIKYVTFNFTFLALFTTILAISISSIANFNPSLWGIIIPILIGLITYLIIFIIFVLRKYTTTSFNHSNLLHYSCIQSKEDFPEITASNLKEFTNLFKKKNEIDLVKNDLKTLIKQYFHQANHDKIGHKMRKCLIFGIFISVFAVLASFIILICTSVPSV